MARTRGLHYSLSSSGPIKWNSNQEASLLQELTPFSPNFDSRSVTSLCEQAREIYLQFLWLPEALMPLSQFIPLLQLLVRDAPSTSSSTHPLHSAIDEILLTGRWCAYKYHDKLPSVLAHAAGPDLEEQIMAFVASRHVEEDTSGSTGGEDPKRRWLLSVEQVQIQILLHLLKLSLPGPCPELPIRPLPAPPRSQKRRRVQHSSSDEDASTPKDILEERLEALMDRLVLWQIGLPNPEDDAAPSGVSQPLRDWTQIFCDDIVQPLSALPRVKHVYHG
ncbi:hypothetical protein BV25DRAFT_939369 [Artomyces pyxidatus]|uniref:Uncharacterized protein n=1 Tax=Artomyces pyxidatus TaxID=48021 RepID=A0ACB8SWF0_9AGAM|nr:hypothetical protein BV25DRAFT_939369 [Artomyces pyxidatus]